MTIQFARDWQEHVETGRPIEGSGLHIKALEDMNAALLAALEDMLSGHEPDCKLPARIKGCSCTARKIVRARAVIKDAS